MKASVSSVLVGLFFFLTCCESGRAQVARSDYFEFHNNYWVNLHHFLYQKAAGRQENRLAEDGNALLQIGEEEVYSALDTEQREVLARAIGFYKQEIIGKSLGFDLDTLRLWLQGQQQPAPLSDTVYGYAYTSMMNEVSGVYQSTFWPVHQRHNESILQKHLEMIRTLENQIIPKMEYLSANAWPRGALIRVDLTAYANWAGAYTLTRPMMNVIISTMDPASRTPAFIETIFHEGSHLLFRFGSPFRLMIYDQSQKAGISFPKGLWHACLFYLCGRTVQQALEQKGITYETLYMDARNIYSNYNTVPFRSILEGYYQGTYDLPETTRQLVAHFQKDPGPKE